MDFTDDAPAGEDVSKLCAHFPEDTAANPEMMRYIARIFLDFRYEYLCDDTV